MVGRMKKVNQTKAVMLICNRCIQDHVKFPVAIRRVIHPPCHENITSPATAKFCECGTLLDQLKQGCEVFVHPAGMFCINPVVSKKEGSVELNISRFRSYWQLESRKHLGVTILHLWFNTSMTNV